MNQLHSFAIPALVGIQDRVAYRIFFWGGGGGTADGRITYTR